MAILLQYNDQVKWTVQQLMNNTGKYYNILHYKKYNLIYSIYFYLLGINYDNMQQILGILLKTRLLECDVDEAQLQADTEISLFLGYKKYVIIIRYAIQLLIYFLHLNLVKNCVSTSISL